MKRRAFIRNTSLFGLGVACYPSILLEGDFDPLEITGQKRPPLFGDNYNLRKRAADAFADMRAAAKSEGIVMYSQSSYRSFEHQNRIWTRKYNMYTSMGQSPIEAINKIILWSTIPGTSRHHWGTDLDIIDRAVPAPSELLNPNNFVDKGAFIALGEWLRTHAEEYGFYLVYTDKQERKGFNYEPWHYSFKELSHPILKEFLKVDLLSVWKESKLNGHQEFTEEFLARYHKENILDINPSLL